MSDFKLFAHRGYAQKGATQNSIKSLDMAVKYGFKAIEFDVWLLSKRKDQTPDFDLNYDDSCESNNHLLVSHDLPSRVFLEKMPEFSEFLSHGNSLEYWIDLKNATTKNSNEFAKKIFYEICKKSIDFSKILIAPFITDYEMAREVLEQFRKVFGKDLRFVCVCEFASEIKPAVDFIKKNQLKFLSINERLIDKTLIKSLSDVEILAWTVNDQRRLEDLVGLGIRNFATDDIVLRTCLTSF